MQLRRNEWGNWRPVADANACDVAAENIVVPMINMMMTGVAGRGDGANFKRRHLYDFIVFQNFDALRRHRPDPAPKTLHVVTENARGRLDQLPRIDQVRRAARMDVNRCSRFRESPRGPGVIEMNMAEKNVAHVLRFRAGVAESSSHVLKSRFRSGIEEGDGIARLEGGRGNDTGMPELFSIQDVNLQSRK